jgi:hypothetical protein
MRARDPRDDPPAKRRPRQYQGPPVTLGHIRSHGARLLLIYCSTGLCRHSAVDHALDCHGPKKRSPGMAAGALVTSIGGLRGSRSPANRAYGARCSGGSFLTTAVCSLRSAACVQVRARLISASRSFGRLEWRAQRIASAA